MRIEVDRNPRNVDETYDRMCEIAAALEHSRARAQVEWSALVGVAATIMAATVGIAPTKRNVSRIGIRMMGAIQREFGDELDRGRFK